MLIITRLETAKTDVGGQRKEQRACTREALARDGHASHASHASFTRAFLARFHVPLYEVEHFCARAYVGASAHERMDGHCRTGSVAALEWERCQGACLLCSKPIRPSDACSVVRDITTCLAEVSLHSTESQGTIAAS